MERVGPDILVLDGPLKWKSDTRYADARRRRVLNLRQDSRSTHRDAGHGRALGSREGQRPAIGLLCLRRELYDDGIALAWQQLRRVCRPGDDRESGTGNAGGRRGKE